MTVNIGKTTWTIESDTSNTYVSNETLTPLSILDHSGDHGFHLYSEDRCSMQGSLNHTTEYHDDDDIGLGLVLVLMAFLFPLIFLVFIYTTPDYS